MVWRSASRFLDNSLVELAQKIPVRHKLGNLAKEVRRIDENAPRKKHTYYRDYDDGKNVLRKSMATILPEHILNRKKQGFSAPDESWYRGENADYVKELLLEGEPISAQYINVDYMRRIVHEHIDDHINHRLLIWSFMCFEWWCRLFLDNQRLNDN